MVQALWKGTAPAVSLSPSLHARPWCDVPAATSNAQQAFAWQARARESRRMNGWARRPDDTVRRHPHTCFLLNAIKRNQAQSSVAFPFSHGFSRGVVRPGQSASYYAPRGGWVFAESPTGQVFCAPGSLARRRLARVIYNLHQGGELQIQAVRDQLNDDLGWSSEMARWMCPLESHVQGFYNELSPKTIRGR